MKYTSEIIIDLPRNRVVELFDSSENAFKWMEGLKTFDHISGDPGEVGAVSKMVFEMGKRKIEMTETITEKNLPDLFHATYIAKGVHNEVKNFFKDEGDKTRWVSESMFKFSGFMAVMAIFMKGAFKKQSMKYLKDFKAFAEKEG